MTTQQAGASFWPQYRTREHPARTLAAISGTQLLTEDGELREFTSYTELVSLLFTGNMLGILSSFVEAWWLADALADPRCSAPVSKLRGLSGIRIQRGSEARWVVAAETWGDVGILTLRRAFDHCGVGVSPTPSSLGMAIMREWYPNDEGVISRLPMGLFRLMHDTVVGGRVDTLSNEGYPLLIEQDQNMAYVAAMQRVPGDRWCAVLRADTQIRGVTSYRKYRIEAADVPLGPLPFRAPGGAVVSYPTEGAWDGYYWWEEIAAARGVGYRCTPLDGPGIIWANWSKAFEGWALHMWQLRRSTLDPDVAGVVKLAAVAAIGRFGCDMQSSQLTAQPDGAIPYCDPEEGLVNPYWVSERREDREGLLIQINSYVMAQTRLALWHKAWPYAARGELVATNYDAIYTRGWTLPDAAGSRADRLGGWKFRVLHNASIPAPRHLVSDEKIRRPGVKR